MMQRRISVSECATYRESYREPEVASKQQDIQDTTRTIKDREDCTVPRQPAGVSMP